MKYTYNAERDRIACKVWEPHFVLASFEDNETKEIRAMMLHTCTNVEKHLKTVAGKYANEGENLTEIKEIPRRLYENWLCGKADVEIAGKVIPAKFVTDFLIAEDTPKENGRGNNSRYGDLSRERQLLLEKDPNLMQAIAQSWEKASQENDIVREVPDPEKSKVIYATADLEQEK